MEASSVLIFIGWVFFEAQFCYFPQTVEIDEGSTCYDPLMSIFKVLWFK